MNVRRHLFTALVSLAVIVFLWAPLVIVAINSINSDTLLASWKGATTHWYADAYHEQSVRSGVQQTMKIAFFSTAISLVLAVTGALWWRRASPRARRMFDLLTYLRIMLPEVVFAVALFLLFSKINFQLGTTAVVIGHTVWNSAYATLIIQARTSTLDPALEAAAADLGANPWRVFRRVTWPGLLPGVVAAGLLAFTFSFDDFVTSFFVAGAGTTTLPLRIFASLRFGVSPAINAMAAMILALTLTAVVVAYAVLRRTGSGRSNAVIPGV